MTKINALYIVCLLFSLIFVTAYSPVRCETKNSAIPAGFIGWEASPPGAAARAVRPSYIIGTVHSICHPRYAFDPDIYRYMSSCEVFVLESKNSIFNYKNEKEYFLPKETSIKKLIGEEKWNKLVEICRKNSIDGNFENYMPWYLSANLTRPDLVDDECVTMDEYLLSKARKKSMKIFGLETMAMSSLNKIPLEAQIEELENIMANFDEIKSAETKLIDAYNSGKVDALYMIINRRQDENKKKVSEKRYREILVDERNTGWLPAVEKHINGSAAFIAVGVAHLTGDNGIIENLKKRGYKLTEISKPARGSRGK